MPLLDQIQRYRLAHDGQYPSNFQVIPDPFRYPNPNRILGQLLICPGVKKSTIAFTNAETQSDYIYVNWTPLLGTNPVPTNYPLVYDRRMANHCGMGINILRVGGAPFWDFRARWLRDFAAKHPEYKLTMPE